MERSKGVIGSMNSKKKRNALKCWLEIFLHYTTKPLFYDVTMALRTFYQTFVKFLINKKFICFNHDVDLKEDYLISDI